MQRYTVKNWDSGNPTRHVYDADEVDAALAAKDQEIARVTKERDNWHEIVKDDCDEDNSFRKAAGSYDHSDSYGIDSHTEILERVLKRLDTLLGEAVWAMETIKGQWHSWYDSSIPDRAAAFLSRPDVREWQARQS